MRLLHGALILVLSLAAATGCQGRLHRLAQSAESPCAGSAESADTLAATEARVRGLEAETGRQALLLLARRIEMERLERRLESNRRLLDDTILEVVRARASQRTPATRAEAAAEIAEAELAIESADDERSRELLTRAGEELDAGNFGGAIFLAHQAESGLLILRGRGGVAERPEQAVDGETPFEHPVPLAVTKRSNFHDGPGPEFRVLKSIEAGTVLTGYAKKGAWVRATVPDGTSGWIHLSLVASDSGS